MFSRTNGGFTLIELMVVISIIGMLAAVILVSLNSARVKANKAKARQEIIQIVRAADLARLLTDSTLQSVTGSNCSECFTEAVKINSLTNISTKSGILGLQNIRTNPWGGVYTMDENEGEMGSTDCRRDGIWATLEPDLSTYYNLGYQTAYCKANPSGTTGWQAAL